MQQKGNDALYIEFVYSCDVIAILSSVLVHVQGKEKSYPLITEFDCC